MKRYTYILILSLIALATACTEKEPSDKEILEGRESESVKLAVSYASGGAAVDALSFTHSPARVELDVNVNNDDLRWNLESDRNWCTVVPDEHKGTGKVVLEIAGNESFDAREEATLTFVAGEYRGNRIKVNQSATAFIVSQPYFTAPLAGGAYNVKVTTVDGTDWNVSGNDWLSVAKGNQQSAGGYTTTVLNITPAKNSGASRYGAVELSSGNEKEKICFWQFGTELAYDTDGNIFFASDKEATLSMTAPAYTVSSVELPSFAKAELKENGDGTSTITISLDDNLSDCGEVRKVDVSIKLSNASASLVELPTLVQDYRPAHGLVTGKGLMKFAEAVANGSSTSDWEKDGVVTIIQDIDMNGITGWQGIGSQSQPFSGTFDGGGYAVVNLKNTSVGLFGYCKGATIKNVSLGKGCAVYNNDEYTDRGCLGGIVSYAAGTNISGCGMSGTLEFAGTSDVEEPSAYIGGIVGLADAASVIQRCSMGGKVIVSVPSAPDVTCYEGGIAGLCMGSLSASEVIGQVAFSSGISTARIGGIEGSIMNTAKGENNSFMGTITLGGNASDVALGGLYGSIESDRSFDTASDKSISLGNIQLNSFNASSGSFVSVGGFAGLATDGVSLSFKGYETQTNITLDAASAVLIAKYVCLGGLLGGCDPSAQVSSLSFDGIQNTGAIKIQYATSVACQVRRMWIGGVAGHINGPATFADCANKGEIGKPEGGLYCARSNGYGEISGGIAGYAHGGNVSFSGCANQANIYNSQYNNNGTTGTFEGMYTPCIAGGILGGFNYNTSLESYTLTMISCTNIREVSSYRGFTGGIVGYCYNASIKSCTNQGRLDNGTNDLSAYRGGIAGGAGNATVTESTAVCDINAKVYGSADNGSAGGVVGMARGDDPVKIDGCAYFGKLQANKMATTQPEYPGGILGCGTDNCTVSNCKYGGSVQGVEINDNNVATKRNVVGNEAGTVSGITYWNGKL